MEAVFAYQNVAIIYVTSANIAANNRGQTVTAREDGRIGGGRAIAREAKVRKEGATERGWEAYEPQTFEKGQRPECDSYPPI